MLFVCLFVFFLKRFMLKRYLCNKSRNTAEISGNWGSTSRQAVFVCMKVGGEGQYHSAF